MELILKLLLAIGTIGFLVWILLHYIDTYAGQSYQKMAIGLVVLMLLCAVFKIFYGGNGNSPQN